MNSLVVALTTWFQTLTGAGAIWPDAAERSRYAQDRTALDGDDWQELEALYSTR